LTVLYNWFRSVIFNGFCPGIDHWIEVYLPALQEWICKSLFLFSYKMSVCI